MEFKDRLGGMFRAKRKDKHMSVRILSEMTDIHPGAIIKFELGKTDMTVSRVFKIMQALEISFLDLQALQLTEKK